MRRQFISEALSRSCNPRGDPLHRLFMFGQRFFENEIDKGVPLQSLSVAFGTQVLDPLEKCVLTFRQIIYVFLSVWVVLNEVFGILVPDAFWRLRTRDSHVDDCVCVCVCGLIRKCSTILCDQYNAVIIQTYFFLENIAKKECKRNPIG